MIHTWADAGDGSGLNKLGKMLMDIRKTLPDKAKDYYEAPWIKFPNIEHYDIFWKNGEGAIYLSSLMEWYYNLKEECKEEWRKYYPIPKDWKGHIKFY